MWTLVCPQRPLRFGDGVLTFMGAENTSVQVGDLVEVAIKQERQKALVIEVIHQKPAFVCQPILQKLASNILEQWQIDLAKSVAEQTLCPVGKIIPLMIPRRIWEGGWSEPMEEVVSIQHSPKIKLGKKQQAIINHLTINEKTPWNTLRQATNASKTTLTTLLAKNIVTTAHERLYTSPVIIDEHDFDLRTEQQKVLNSMLNTKQNILLSGSTASGKSHTLRALAHNICQKLPTAQILFLVPEIALSNELMQKMQDIFGSKAVVAWHSKLSDGERWHAWWKIKKGTARVIVGNRSAVWLPFYDLQLSCIEEEHEWTYKSETAPKYWTHDVMQSISNIHQSKFIVSSATPSLKTYQKSKLLAPQEGRLGGLSEETSNKHVAQKGDQLKSLDFCESQKSKHIHISFQHQNHDIKIVDMHAEKMSKHFSPVSRQLLQSLKISLAKKQQSLLFLNKRGTFRVCVCHQCGEALRSPVTETALVVHQFGQRFQLICHHSGRIYDVPERCPECHATQLQFQGSGTANIENIIQQYFPHANILRWDADTSKNKTQQQHLQQQMHTADVIIGTQMIAKGLDFSRITTIGIVNADQGLHLPDITAEERTFQLITQVIGRGGRRGQKCHVWLQTYLPDHPLWQYLKQQNYFAFADNELEKRKQLKLPPHCEVIKITCVATTSKAAFHRARQIEQEITNYPSIILRTSSLQITSDNQSKIKNQKLPADAMSLHRSEANHEIRQSAKIASVWVAPALIPKKAGKYFVNVFVLGHKPVEIVKKLDLKGVRIDVQPVDLIS